MKASALGSVPMLLGPVVMGEWQPAMQPGERAFAHGSTLERVRWTHAHSEKPAATAPSAHGLTWKYLTRPNPRGYDGAARGATE